jgi:thiamine-monophosphate kinase
MKPLGEFDLIARYFKRPARRAVLGVGDDCALLQPRPGTQLAISTDMLVQGRHFLPGTDPQRLGHKALAVNLSDLAACGATPLAFTLALALPEADPAWLAPFAQGLLALADAHDCELVGGDTTRGPLNICITVFGEVPVVDGRSQALLRSGAQAGDELYVSGHLGDAALGLETLTGSLHLPPAVAAAARERLERPSPRVALGQALRGIASAAIDVSDGLLGDLGHILQQSGVGATVEANTAMQLIASYQDCKRVGSSFGMELSQDRWRRWALAGGDDYELLFTAPPAAREAVAAAASRSQTLVTRIGRIEAQPGLRVVNAQGQAISEPFTSFDHFAA